MTNKDNLQKELKEKIKEGIKPSQIKKERQKQVKKPISPSPIVESEDEGYISEEEVKIPTPPPLPNQEIKNLQTKIKALERQLQTYKDFKEADLKIKEKLKEQLKEKEQIITKHEQSISNLQAKIKEQYKTIEGLKKQIKSKGDIKQEKLFTCSRCELEWSAEFCKLVDKQGNKTCAECLENMLVNQEEKTKPEPTQLCQFCSKSYPQSELKPRHIKNLPNHDPKEITLICQTCLTYRAIKDEKIIYCPRLGKGRDTYEGKEFDCYCSP